MHARNPRLVYGRMTGWGQSGPLAERAGHDINYIAIAGVLNAIGRAGEAPVPPLNLVGDFGGGGMLLAFGIACGVIEARASGRGQVVDAAMVDGASLLATMFSGFLASGMWKDGARGATSSTRARPGTTPTRRATAGTSRSARSKPKFYAELLDRLGLDASLAATQHDRVDVARAARPSRRDASRSGRAPSGRRSSPAPTRASRRCCRSPNRAAHPHVAARAGTIERRRHRPARARAALRSDARARRPSPPPERGSGGAEALQRWGFDDGGDRGLARPGRRLYLAAQGASRRKAAATAICQSAARASAHSPADSAARPSSRSFSRCAVSERIATACRCGGTSA